MKFAIGEWVAHTATVMKKSSGEVEEAPASPPHQISQTVRVSYVGRIKKAIVDETGERFWVAFGPRQQWVEMQPSELERAAISINPPTCDPGDKV